MQKSKTIRTLASLMIAVMILLNIPYTKTEAKTFTDQDVIQMFKGDKELDTDKVLEVISGMNLNTKQRNFFKVIIPLAIKDMIENDILASLTIAQSVWEGGWGVGNMAIVANNIFGIMAASNWEGKVYNTTTKQVYDSFAEAKEAGGSRFFRAYDSWEESLRDHSELFLNSERYQVFIGLRDYKKACNYVYSTGYATSSGYPNELIGTIESHNLTIFDTIAKEILKARELAASIMPTSVSINASKITLGLGSTYTLKATVQPSDANDSITWTTNKAGITVTEGVVYADAVGTSNVLAETINGMGVECVVTVLKDFDFILVGSVLSKYTGNSKIVTVPEGVSTLNSGSFKNNKSISEIIIPSNVKTISDSAFSGCNESMVICGYEGTYAEEYAKKNNFSFKSITNILFDAANHFATDVSSKTTVQEIIASLGKDVSITDIYNETMDKNSINYVGTGCTISFQGEDYVIAVKGDVNGDGIISSSDHQILARYFKKLKNLTGEYYEAADVNGDGKINATDYLKIKQAFQTGNRYVS